MAVIPITVSQSGSPLIVSWPALANGNSGQPINLSNYDNITVSISGTIGSGGQPDMEISQDNGVTWNSVMNGFNVISVPTALPVVVTIGSTAWPLFRPHVTGGDTATAVVYQVFANKVRNS